MKDPDLWNRLTGHDFPLDDKGKTLLSHLVDHTTLGKAKAPIAIQEYRKFLYLAATSGEIVAPSPLIDRLWHTHIQHTRVYFEDFCPRTIGRLIHHAPGRAGADQDPAYARTLVLYAAAFGAAPPETIWPPQDLIRRRERRNEAAALSLCVLFIGGIVTSEQWRLAVAAMIFGSMVVGLAIFLGIQQQWDGWTTRPRRRASGCVSDGSGGSFLGASHGGGGDGGGLDCGGSAGAGD